MSVSHNHNNSGYDVYRCDGCGCSGRSPMDAGLPDGWTQTFIMGNYLCPRCSVKREEKKAERKAQSNNAPSGKKVKKGCGCLFIAFLVLLLLPKFCGDMDEAKANQTSQAEHSQTESVSEQP